MAMTIWFPALACICLLAYLLLQRDGDGGESPERLALLVGARRVWGETDASLRRRSVALSRWPFKVEEPELRWWGRLWERARGRRR
jgi:hypothetical protein